jgi:hypothetical protein
MRCRLGLRLATESCATCRLQQLVHQLIISATNSVDCDIGVGAGHNQDLVLLSHPLTTDFEDSRCLHDEQHTADCRFATHLLHPQPPAILSFNLLFTPIALSSCRFLKLHFPEKKKEKEKK